MDSISTCSRCGSPNYVVKTWIETIETRSGKSKLTHSQLACTNKECQKNFEIKRTEEIKKREEIKMKNEAYAAKKKADLEIALADKAASLKKITLK